MHLLKYREIYNKTPIIASKIKFGGEFRLILRNCMGGVVQDTGWFHNLITNYGLNYGFHATWYSYIHLGSSNAAPDFTQSALINWLGYNNPGSITGVAAVNSGSPLYYGIQTIGKRFDAGNATGTIREVGLGTNTGNYNMCVRSLVSPEVVKAADQVLDVYYRMTAYPDLSDQTGVANIGGIDYNYTSRISTCQEFGAFGVYKWYTSTFGHAAYYGNIGSITETPTGLMPGEGGYMPYPTIAPIQVGGGSGNAYIDWQVKWPLDRGNHASGFRSARSSHQPNISSSYPGIQTQFNAVSDSSSIPKDNTKELYLNWRLSWARH